MDLIEGDVVSDVSKMPKYICTKVVRALKIKEIFPAEPPCDGCESSGRYIIVPTDPEYSVIEVSAGYVEMYHPEVGGYIVLDAGDIGYASARVFESEYDRIYT